MNVVDFCEISLADTPLVGGKNASLGELYRNISPQGVRALDGFAVTSSAYHLLLKENGLADTLSEILDNLEPDNVESLAQIGEFARAAIMATKLPQALIRDIEDAYDRLCDRLDRTVELAVRSSATAEDLPQASFAGQHETYLNVVGKAALVEAIHRCFASLYTDRAIDYRVRNGFEHSSVALSVGVQPMIRSDLASSGVIFTLDTETGFPNVVQITGSYGLGEYVVQGSVNPDEWTVFKTTLDETHRPIVGRRLGSKEHKLVFCEDESGTQDLPVAAEDRSRFCLTDDEVLQLAKWACLIESHYSKLRGHRLPMDIEWAKDGVTGEIFITQARPETVHAQRPSTTAVRYGLLTEPPRPIVRGQAVGERIASGPVRIVKGPADLPNIKLGDVLVARSTDPDWEPVMKQVAAIVTDQGGRTSHAAIVSREIGVPCVVGALNATHVLSDGQIVTVCCAEGAEGHVYPGRLAFSTEEAPAAELLKTKTKIMMNVGDPSKAFSLASLPNDGVGLARMEFIISSAIGIHPVALCRYPDIDPAARDAIAERLKGADPEEFFIQRLSEGIATIAAAFYPKPVIVRTSDFKTNEYARLLGGSEFEPLEENPMLGFRGASRYYDPRYVEGFSLECLALKRVREEMGLDNVKVMIPFCRTVAEAKQVLAVMETFGLTRQKEDLEVIAMCELPSNALDADAFLEVFDGFSIGSNDLTQLTLGVDRDAGSISKLFDEQDPAVKALISMAIEAAHRADKPIGICGQAPSDYPEFARWLVQLGITSVSLNPDSVLKTIPVVAEAESKLAGLLETPA